MQILQDLPPFSDPNQFVLLDMHDQMMIGDDRPMHAFDDLFSAQHQQHLDLHKAQSMVLPQ